MVWTRFIVGHVVFSFCGAGGRCCLGWSRLVLSVYQEDGLVVCLIEPEFFQLLWGHTCEVSAPVAIPISPATEIEETTALVIRANSKTGIRCPMGLATESIFSGLLGECLDLPEIRARTMPAHSTTMTIIRATWCVRNQGTNSQCIPGSVVIKTTLSVFPDFVRIIGKVPGTRF